MLFSLVVGLMVILVAAFWAYQGFFSSIIMFFESVLAALLAFAFFESVHDLWAESIGVGIGLPLAFMGIFSVSLLLMRVLTDKLIPNTVNLNLYVERAGGGIFGLFTGLILVGSALVSIQMLPIGSDVLGFERLEVDRQGLPVHKSFLLKPDAFVVGMANMLSNGRFGGDNPLARAKPDYLLDLYSARAAPQTEARFAVPDDCLHVESYWEFRKIDHVSQRAEGGTLQREFFTEEATVTLLDRQPAKFIVCQVRLDPKAAKEKRPTEIRFRVPQFRLVGPRPEKASPSSKPRVYPACGMSDIYTHRQHELREVQKSQWLRLVRFSPLTDMILSPAATKTVAKVTTAGKGDKVLYYEFDVAFEVPDDPDFEPWYIEFKRGARVELHKKAMKIDPPDYALSALAAGGGGGRAASSTSGGRKVGQAPKGRVHVANAVEERTGATAVLPMTLDGNERLVARHLRGGKFQEGHIWVVAAGEEFDPDAAVTEFLVPGGKRMVQIGAEQVMAGSMFGRALNYAASIAAQIKIHTSDGRTYFAQGVYALAPVGGEMIFEIQYWPEAGMPERCLKKPKKLTRNVMKNAKKSERKFGYIFLVDPGVKITGFSAGSRARKPQKLSIEVPG